MSVLRVDTLEDVAETVSIDVVDISTDKVIREDLGNSSDPTKGAALVGRSIRRITNKSELASLTPQYPGERVYLGSSMTTPTGDGTSGQGVFKWVETNLSAKVSGDPLQGLYVAPTASPTGAGGAWVREWDGVNPLPEWWGGSASPKGLNSTNAPVSLLKNRVGATQDTVVLLFGDSHGWGQGSPEAQLFLNATQYSTHSSNIHNRGFMARISDSIEQRRGFKPATYGAWTPAYPSSIYPGQYKADAISLSEKDPSKVFPLIPVCGVIQGTLASIAQGPSTNMRFFSPDATGAVSYSTLFREKLEIGLFGARRLLLSTESATSFRANGKDKYFEISINPAKTPSGAGVTTYSNPGVGVYAEAVVSTGRLSVHTSHVSADIPSWMQPGSVVLVPGHPLVKVWAHTASAGGTNIELVTTANAELGATTFVKCLKDRLRFYHPAYVTRSVHKLPMRAPAQVAYVAVTHTPGGGTLDLFFADTLRTGGLSDPVFGASVKQLTSTGWSWAAAAGSAGTISGPGPDVLPAPKTSITSNSFRIDTSPITTGVTEEVIYRIDFGATQYGDLYLEATGPVLTRGVVLDNNKVVNLSMGGHSVGAWLGQEPSFNDAATDHIAQILTHVPVQPSHIITQIPFVNEFLAQTPIAVFKTRLLEFTNRFKNHLNGSNNFNIKGVDFLFFTSLRNREIAFGVGPEPGVTYNQYVQATKEFCADNGHVFIDCEAALFAKVRSGQIDAERLYSDSNHPSDYANELIFLEVNKHLPAVV